MRGLAALAGSGGKKYDLLSQTEAQAACGDDCAELPGWILPPQDCIDVAVGPAINRFRIGGLALLLTQIGFFYLVKYNVWCSAAGLAVYSPWIWLAAIPGACVRCYAEYVAVRHWLGTFLFHAFRAGLNPCRILGIRISCRIWYAVMSVFSLLNFLDVCSDSVLAATTLRSFQCSKGAKMLRVWRQTWGQTLVPFGLPEISLPIYIFFIWAASLLQLIVPLVRSLRKEELRCQMNYEVGAEGRGKRLCGGTELKHADVFAAVAEATGSAPIQSQFIQVAKAFANADMIKLCESEASCILRWAIQTTRSMQSRLWTVYLLENALQLNLRAAIFALNQAILGHSHLFALVQLQTMISLALGFITSGLKLIEIRGALRYARSVLSRIDEIESTDGPLDERIAFKRRSLKRLLWSLRMGSVVFSILLLIGVCRFIGVYVCEDFILLTSGCADINEVRRHGKWN